MTRQCRMKIKITRAVILFSLTASLAVPLVSRAQDSSTQQQKPPESSPSQSAAPNYSGMYSFLKDGEFLQVTVEDRGAVTGYISRYGDGESDKGEFLDQFFKNGKLDGTKLNFTTEIVHGVSFDFRGGFERGEGKNPGDEAYYVLKGTLTQNVSDADKKVRSQSREVLFKLFPQESGPPAAVRQ